MKWIRVTYKNNICEITLNRPNVRNAFDPEMIEEITQAFKNITTQIRIVIFRGAGDVFCAGADLEWMKSMVSYTLEENKSDSLKLYEMFKSMQECHSPIITVVQGAAMGGALGLMAVSDIVISEDTTKFCFSEVKLGLAPAVISSFVLKKVSLGMVMPWMTTGKVFGPNEALRFGLVHQVVFKDGVEEALAAWITTLTEAAPQAVNETKALLNQINNLDEEKRKEKTISLIAERRVSAEGQEGLKAFLEKKSPSWKTLWKN